jgi:hypothetical protein
MERQFRQDLICERQRGTQEIRDELARLIKLHRNLRTDIFKHATEAEIEMLKWVLNHDLPLDKYYRERYNREHGK